MDQQVRRSDESDRPGTQIQIQMTAAMIDAGVDAYLECDREYDSFGEIVTRIFVAMEQARLQSREVASDR
jgi:hypothetical protein